VSETTAPPSPRLTQLAEAYGVATDFWDWQGRHTTVPASTIVAVLAALEVDASDDAAVEASLRRVQDAPWRAALPPVVVTRSGKRGEVPVHVPAGDDGAAGTGVTLVAELEDGGSRAVAVGAGRGEQREVDGRQVVRLSADLPKDLPLGWHVLRARWSGGEATCPLVVTPDRLELVAGLAERQAWGLMAQVYSVRSRDSWGLGDLADLGELADWGGRDLGADFVLINPLHAAEPVGRMEPSPYLPASRRFFNPVYLRVEDVREAAYLSAADRARVEELGAGLRVGDGSPADASGSGLERDPVWAAKREALGIVFGQRRSPARQAALEAFCAREGDGLEQFAFWCALAEHFGLPSSTWPAQAHAHGSELLTGLRAELDERVRFYMWLQWLADEQLAAVQRAARAAGMGIGVVHDLAVGVHPEGADTWALQDVMARGVSVGAPPDAFNQQGQDWSQPPWRPDGLAAAGYAPYRDMLRTILRHAGGVRVDHVIGLFRLWWVPQGHGPVEGTYVRYDHEALIGILCLEAHRAGAFVVGEDLGTVEPWVREYLRDRGVMGTSILWFERDWEGDRGPLPPESWRELCLATVTTHDLPPTAGYLTGEHIALRDRLGLLTRSVEEERAADAEEQSAVLAQLRRMGLLGQDGGEQQVVEALHRFLTMTPSRLLGVAVPDAVGDRRTQNQPGTSDEYPNWRVPLADGEGRAVLLEDLRSSERAASLARVVQEGLGRS
jgi:4-alpha-glucanotransferase